MATAHPRPSNRNLYGSVLEQLRRLDRTLINLTESFDSIFECLQMQIPGTPGIQTLRQLVARHGIVHRDKYLLDDLVQQYSVETWTTELHRLQNLGYWNESLHYVFLQIIADFINCKLVVLCDDEPPQRFNDDGKPIDDDSVVVVMSEVPYQFHSTELNFGYKSSQPALYDRGAVGKNWGWNEDEDIIEEIDDWSRNECAAFIGNKKDWSWNEEEERNRRYQAELAEMRDIEKAIFLSNLDQQSPTSASLPARPRDENLKIYVDTPAPKPPCQDHPKNVTEPPCNPELRGASQGRRRTPPKPPKNKRNGKCGTKSGQPTGFGSPPSPSAQPRDESLKIYVDTPAPKPPCKDHPKNVTEPPCNPELRGASQGRRRTPPKPPKNKRNGKCGTKSGQPTGFGSPPFPSAQPRDESLKIYVDTPAPKPPCKDHPKNVTEPPCDPEPQKVTKKQLSDVLAIMKLEENKAQRYANFESDESSSESEDEVQKPRYQRG